MDATRFQRLTRLLSVVAVSYLTVAPSARADESSKIVFTKNNSTATEPGMQDETTSRSATGTLVFLPSSKPKANRSKEEVQQVSSEATVSARRQRGSVAARQRQSPHEMLIEAHELAQTASTEQQYGRVARLCDEAESLGVEGEQLVFALQLQAWAVRHREALRVKRMQREILAQKAEQQRHIAETEQQLRTERAKQLLRAEKAEQKLRAEQLAKKLRAERVAEKRDAVRIQEQLRSDIYAQRMRAERAEQALASRSFDLESPEPADEAYEAAAHGADGTELQAASDKQSNDWQWLHDRAVTLAEEGRSLEALKDFNRVLEINPMFAKAYSNRATLHSQGGNLESAQADYHKACSLDSELLHAQLGLGRTYHLLGQHEQALERFGRAIELAPEKADIYCSRGDLLVDMGRYRDALADYARTIDLDPEFAHAYRNGAWLLATCPDPRFRDPQNAIRGAQRALESGYGDRHVALDTLAAAHASAGQFGEAIEALQEALKIAPQDSRYVYRSRLQRYQAQEPFIVEPVEDVSQAVYEVSDR